MEWRRIKNIIIILLLLVNGFLLALVWARRAEALVYERSALTQAVEALAEQGIQADLEALAPAEDLAPLSLQRDTGREARLAEALLGEGAESSNLGGGLYVYRGEAGEVSFRAGGELSVTLTDSPRWEAADPAAHAADLMERMELEGEQLSLAETEQGTEVTFRQLWEGAPLFSCSVTFTYRDGRLRTVAGQLLASDTAVPEAGTVLTLPTALMRFLEGIQDSGDVCSAILSMEPGYRSGQSLSGAVRLTPVWRVTTNTADYYLDASTGVLTRADGDAPTPAALPAAPSASG